jgi:hypothetical protein
MMEKQDWGRIGWHLRGKVLMHRHYRQYGKNLSWDHDHGEFCGVEFALRDDPEVQREGYATEDDYHWICTKCFTELREEFEWTAKEEMN